MYLPERGIETLINNNSAMLVRERPFDIYGGVSAEELAEKKFASDIL